MLSVIYAKYHLCQVSFMPSVIYAKCHLCQLSFMPSVIRARCRKIGVYAECLYVKCHGVTCVL
jgi:hypothetical protein